MDYTFIQFFYTHYQPVINEDIEQYLCQHLSFPFYKILDSYLAKKKILKRQLCRLCSIDRRTIYKIYHQPNYQPSKRVVICLGLGLHLEPWEFEALLHDAGYHLSQHQKLDVVIMYCLKAGIYSLTQVDIYLEQVGEKTLIGLN